MEKLVARLASIDVELRRQSDASHASGVFEPPPAVSASPPNFGGGPVRKYHVVSTAAVTRERDLPQGGDAQHTVVAKLLPGEVLTVGVSDVELTDRGEPRIRLTGRGWVSIVAQDGTVLLSEVCALRNERESMESAGYDDPLSMGQEEEPSCGEGGSSVAVEDDGSLRASTYTRASMEADMDDDI